MKTTSFTAIFFSLVLIGQPGQAAEKLRVLDQGIDGNQRTYLVTCADGGLSSVVQTFNIPSTASKRPPPAPDVMADGGNRAHVPQVTRVCISQRQGQDICKPGWDVDEAARASCR